MTKRRRRQGPSHSTSSATAPGAVESLSLSLSSLSLSHTHTRRHVGEIRSREDKKGNPRDLLLQETLEILRRGSGGEPRAVVQAPPLRRRDTRKDEDKPPAERKKKIDEASAMLLYEAPSGIAIFSFDGAYLENPVKDFWSDLPQLSLEFFLRYERVSTPFDPDNDIIDNNLAKRLTKLCGLKKKLAVCSGEHNKKIIEEKLGITCLYVHVPDCEVIICSLKNPMRTLLPEEMSETYKRKCLPNGKELITFLCQHGFDVKPEMVNKSIVELAHLLHGIELREMEHLKFLRILLKDFMVISGIGTKSWSLIELATVLKVICYRGSSYEVYHPNEIFSHDEHQKILVNASRYKTSFSNIDVLSVYKDVISLDSNKYILLVKLDCLVEKAKEVPEKAEVIILPTGSKAGKEGSTDVDDRLNSIAKGNCSEVTLGEGKLDFSWEWPQQDVKQILTILDEDPSMKKPNSNEKICNEEVDQCLISDKVEEKLAENMDGVERNKQAGDTGVQSMDDYAKKLTASALVLLGNNKDEHTNASVKEMNLQESMGGDYEKNKHSGGTKGGTATSVSSKSESNKQKEVIPATSEIPKYGPLKDLDGHGKKPTASTPGLLGKQDGKQEMNLPVGDKENVQSMDSGKKKLLPVLTEKKKNEEFTATSWFNSGFNVLNKGIIGTSLSSNSGPGKENEKIPTTSKIPKSGSLKVQHTDTSVKNLPEVTSVDEEDMMASPASGEIHQSGKVEGPHL